MITALRCSTSTTTCGANLVAFLYALDTKLIQRIDIDKPICFSYKLQRLTIGRLIIIHMFIASQCSLNSASVIQCQGFLNSALGGNSHCSTG